MCWNICPEFKALHIFYYNSYNSFLLIVKVEVLLCVCATWLQDGTMDVWSNVITEMSTIPDACV